MTEVRSHVRVREREAYWRFEERQKENGLSWNTGSHLIMEVK